MHAAASANRRTGVYWLLAVTADYLARTGRCVCVYTAVFRRIYLRRCLAMLVAVVCRWLRLLCCVPTQFLLYLMYHLYTYKYVWHNMMIVWSLAAQPRSLDIVTIRRSHAYYYVYVRMYVLLALMLGVFG